MLVDSSYVLVAALQAAMVLVLLSPKFPLIVEKVLVGPQKEVAVVVAAVLVNQAKSCDDFILYIQTHTYFYIYKHIHILRAASSPFFFKDEGCKSSIPPEGYKVLHKNKNVTFNKVSKLPKGTYQ